MPEAVGSIVAQLDGAHGDIALGNAIGSNIANIGLILGLGALAHPIPISQKIVKREMPIMFASLAVLWLMMMKNNISRLDGVILLVMLLAYVIYHIRSAKQDSTLSKQAQAMVVDNVQSKTSLSMLMNIIWFVLGVSLLVFGGYIFIRGAIEIAKVFEVPDSVIALTLVALGTSLPELATTLVAAIRKEPDIAIGNVLGSNIFNFLFVIGAAALVLPIHFGETFINRDMPFLLGFGILMWMLMWKKAFFSRVSGGILIIAYIVYLIVIT